MQAYPLFKTRLSNERLMTALLLVLILYNLPRFIAQPGSILQMLLLVALGLVIDAAAHFVLYKRPICAVPAAVTALILFSLSPGAAFWEECVALAAALAAGKIVWGGTGKNPFNPAMAGLLLLALISPIESPAFQPTLLLIPAAVLSLPFLLIRPYAGAGMLLGMTAALLPGRDLSLTSLLAEGVFFWSCLVITDPVTTTSKPAASFVLGALAGFAPLMIADAPFVMPLAVLLSNLLSYLADRLDLGPNEKLRKTFGRRQKITFSSETTQLIDISGTPNLTEADTDADCETILRRIEEGSVTGCGGAAFPTVKKLRAAADSTQTKKYLIVNAAECDPGLIHDKWLLTHRTEDIARGIALLCRCVAFDSVTVAAKDFFGTSFPPDIRRHALRDWYPAGAERLLIRDVLGIDPGPREVPAQRGILVLNVQTVIAVLEAVTTGRKADARYLTAADLGSGTGTVIRVRMGKGIYETAQKIHPNASYVYTGGGAMGACLAGDDAVIGEKTNFIAVGSVKGFREAICSRCNLCSAYCPEGLHVREIANLTDIGKSQEAARFHPEKCINCSLCSSVCLAGRDQAKRVNAAVNAAK